MKPQHNNMRKAAWEFPESGRMHSNPSRLLAKARHWFFVKEPAGGAGCHNAKTQVLVLFLRRGLATPAL